MFVYCNSELKFILKTTTTTYIAGIVYQNDTLQFIPHEEGRARWALHKYTNGTSAYGYEYDFFLKVSLRPTSCAQI
jgi:hypothetical protein